MLTALLTSAVSADVENVRATIMREKAVQDRTAVNLPDASGMFGDVGTPQLVRDVRGETSIDQVNGSVNPNEIRLFATLGVASYTGHVRT